MTSYSVQEAYDGIMKTERGFDTYGEAFRFFKALCRGTGSKAKDVWLVQYDDDDQEGYELAHKEIRGKDMKFFDEDKNDLLSMLAHSIFIGVFIGALVAAVILIIMGVGE